MTKKKEIENRRDNFSSFSCNNCGSFDFSRNHHHVRYGRQ